MSAPEGSARFASRRGWSFGRRVREPDSYGLLLGLIVLVLFSAVLGGTSAVGATIATALAAAMLLFALRTSLAPRALQRAMALVAPLLVVATASSFASPPRVADVVTPITMGLLVLGALAAVLRRLVAHPVVAGPTIVGAVCAYLLIGVLFASVYSVFDEVGPVFVQLEQADAVDLIYFSFITLATVGYGDLTPSGDLVRIVAVVEALSGQLYLVTVIAVLVSNVGARRRMGSDRSDV